jgi:CBS domain-containing protein
MEASKKVEKKEKKEQDTYSSESDSDDTPYTVKDVLSLYTLGELVPKESDRLVLNLSMMLPEALKLMAGRGDHIAPVSDGKQIVGTIELTRIVRSIVSSLRDKDAVFDAKDFDVEEFKEVVGEENFNKCSVNDVRLEFMDPQEGGFIYHVSTPLHFAVYTMSYGQHRFPLVDKGGVFYGFWRPFSVAKVLHAHLDDLGEVMNTPVSALKPEEHLKHVVQVSAYDKLVRAFRTTALNYWQCSGIVVLDGSSRVMGNISSPDLRLVVSDVPKSFANLYLTAGEFLKKVHEVYPDSRAEVISVKLTATLAQVLQLLSDQKVFRVYVVNDDGILVGVVRLADILEYLLPPLVQKHPLKKKDAVLH